MNDFETAWKTTNERTEAYVVNVIINNFGPSDNIFAWHIKCWWTTCQIVKNDTYIFRPPISIFHYIHVSATHNIRSNWSQTTKCVRLIRMYKNNHWAAPSRFHEKFVVEIHLLSMFIALMCIWCGYSLNFKRSNRHGCFCLRSEVFFFAFKS